MRRSFQWENPYRSAIFINYKDAFDSVSHKFVDEALEQDGVSTKARAMYRVVYTAAVSFTLVKDTDGKQVCSDRFSIAH